MLATFPRENTHCAALIRASEIGYSIVRWCGAAYLIFLGSQLIWRGRLGRRVEEPAVAGSSPARRHVAADYLTGVGTNLFNPKVGIFFVSFLPVFIPRGVSVAPASLMLGGVFLAEGIVWLTAIVWLAARVSAILSRSGIRRRMERLTGLVMVGFGVRLAIGRR